MPNRSGHGGQLPRDVVGLGAWGGGDGCGDGMEDLWGEGLWVGWMGCFDVVRLH